MDTHVRFLVTLAGLLTILPISATGQDSLRVVVLSPKLGPLITAETREEFGLFRTYDGFQSAVVCQSRSGAFYAYIQSRSQSGDLTRQLVPYPYTTLRMMAEKVDHLPEILAGTYQMGTLATELKYADSAAVAKIAMQLPKAPELPKTGQSMTIAVPQAEAAAFQSAPPSDTFPFAGSFPPLRLETYPLLRFGVGLSSYSWEATSIQRMLDRVQEKFRSQGYALSRDEFRGITGPMLWFSLNLMLSPSLGALLETGNAGEETASLKIVSLSLYYRPPIALGTVLQPYVALGAARYALSVAQNYPHSERISAVDSVGAYWRLAQIAIAGADSKYGAVATLGVELLGIFPLNVDLFVRYALAPSTGLTTSWGESVKVSLGGYLLGARAMIRF